MAEASRGFGQLRVDPELLLEFPGLHAIELPLGPLVVRRIDPRLEAQKARTLEEVRKSRAGPEGIREEPIFRAYRDFYWKIGVDPTKTRPAAEALTRRSLGGREIPCINTLVDACNLVSLQTSISIAAFDADRLHPKALVLRRARSGEEFRGIGMNQPMTLRGVEMVIEDLTDRTLVANYPYRDSERARITEATRRAVLFMCGVPGIEIELLERAGRLCQEFVTEYCQDAPSS